MQPVDGRLNMNDEFQLHLHTGRPASRITYVRELQKLCRSLRQLLAIKYDVHYGYKGKGTTS
jgi:hypothetical protein